MSKGRDFLLQESKKILELWSKAETLELDAIEKLAERVKSTFKSNGILAFAGNGGSAAEANHLAAEFIGRCVVDHRPLRALSLSENNSILTALVNDYGADQLFARQVEALLNPESILIGLSTSGTSPNVLAGLAKAKELGAYTIMWTGAKQKENLSYVDEIWRVPSLSTPRIQEVHLAWGHLLAEVIEQTL